MIEELQHIIPADFYKFFLVVVFSLFIGLEQRQHHLKEEFETLYGTDRTLTLIGILGYILYIISPQTLIPFLGGGAAVSILLSIFYFQKIQVQKLFGITSLVIALITYCLAPLIYTQPAWLVLLVVIAVLVITELKETLFEFSKKVEKGEFITLAKFLMLAGVVLPLLPDEPISSTINISPYRFWLAIVAVSGVSYLSYIFKKFVFPNAGIILTGILGGLYSSTATTIILAKKSRELRDDNKVIPAIILATTMMYLRVLLLALFFNQAIALQLAPSFAIFIVVSSALAIYFLRFNKTTNKTKADSQNIEQDNNPLELKTALIFAGLFIFFALITGFVRTRYGIGGINVLSFVVGVTDIDPFILNLFQSKWNMENTTIAIAVLNAISSNNLLKMIYGVSFSDKSIRRQIIIAFGILIVLGLMMSFVFYL